MEIRNHTPHSVVIYPEAAFNNLRHEGRTLVADGVGYDSSDPPIAEYHPIENLQPIRISSDAIAAEEIHLEGGSFKIYEIDRTAPIKGLTEADLAGEFLLIVSERTKMQAIAIGHPIAQRMIYPYNVVRLSSDTTKVLGCMGFSR